MKASEDDLPDISCVSRSPGHDRNDPTRIQVESSSKDGPEPDFTDAHSDEVSSKMEAEANIAGTPAKAQLKEDPQAVGGEKDEQEDTSNLGRPQRRRQAPKRLTYDSPGEPTYVRQVKADQYVGIQQCRIPTPPTPYIPEFPVNQYCTLPPVLNYISPPVPPMFWNTYMMMPYMPYPVVPQLPQWGAPYQSFQ